MHCCWMVIALVAAGEAHYASGAGLIHVSQPVSRLRLFEPPKIKEMSDSDMMHRKQDAS